MNRYARIGKILVLLLFVFSLCLPNIPIWDTGVSAVTQSEIDELQSEADDLSAQKSMVQKQLNSLAANKKNVMQRKSLLDEQISLTQAEISNVEEQVRQYERMIADMEQQIREEETRVAQQYETFCVRVRAMEERGDITLWSILFDSESFADFLAAIDFISEIMESDTRLLEELKAAREMVIAQKKDLESALNDVQRTKVSLESKNNELTGQLTEANNLIIQIEENEEEYQETLDAIRAEEEAVQQEILRKSQELAAQQGTQTVLGGYIWPVESRRITSPFGMRMHPTKKRQLMHNGVDIGGVGFTSKVKAAKSGTVITSKKNNSYGEYVVISHGSGNTTLYAHLSKRSVKEGDVVQQGDVIGITGSTGNSTGPHLHFEINENSDRIDPLQYLTGYVEAW